MKKDIKTNLKRWCLWRSQSNEFFHIAGANPESALDQTFYRQIKNYLEIHGTIDKDRYHVHGTVKTFILELDNYEKKYSN